MNRKENEILGIQTGKIKLTQEEIKRREAKEKQRKLANRKRFLIVSSSVVAIAIMISGVVLLNNWNVNRKAAEAAVKADKALWPKGVVKPTKAEIAQINEEVVVLETTLGTIKLSLDPVAAPLTVMNFRKLVNEKFYDGVIFHRVIKDFMVQAGGETEKGPKEPLGYSFKDEINAKALGLTAQEISANEATQSDGKPGYKYDETLKSFKMVKGVLAMANAGANTNQSEFFIVTAKDGTPWLNGKHTAFGRVVEGQDVADKIQVQPTKSDKPLKNIVIKKAYIEKRVKK
jgi:cyclophilin family peptidyl-prolyl cis-trans isomerase